MNIILLRQKVPFSTIRTIGCQNLRHIRRRIHNILFFGSDELSLLTLEAIRSNPACYNTLEVVTPPDNPKAKKESEAAVLLKRYCQKNGIISHDAPPKTMRDWKVPTPKNSVAFDLGVVVSFGYFIPSHVLDTLSKGAINVHPSILPRYRGASPIQYTILNDDKECGVTIQEKTPEHPNYDSLLQFLGTIAAKDLTHVLLHLDTYRSTSIPQSESLVSSAPKFEKQAGNICLEKDTAASIERLYRAIGSKIPLQVDFNNKTAFLLGVENPKSIIAASYPSMESNVPPGTILLTSDKKFLQIKTCDGFILCHSVHVQGKKPLNAKDFWNGYAAKNYISPFKSKLKH